MLLVIDQRNTHVRCDRKTLLIDRGGATAQRIPINLLDNVVIIGNPTIDTNVWRALSDAAVPATLLPARGSQTVTTIGAGLNVPLPLRRRQYRCAEDATAAIVLARWIITNKLDSYDLPLTRPQLAAQQKAAFLQQREKALAQLGDADSTDTLMGLEGSIASAWFSLLAASLPERWKFTGRNRRPPRDPVNALLSLGYTLLMSDIRQILISEGLDPAFGFLHQPCPAREALTLDLTECFRAGVDDFVLGLVSQFEPSDFNHHQKTGCRLNKSCRQHFYNAWAEQRINWPRLRQQEGESGRQTIPLREQIRGKIMTLRQTIKTALGETET